jgi:putative DNA primase/helicase
LCFCLNQHFLLGRNGLDKCFILTSDGANGKSTLLKCITRLIKRQNIASLGLGALGQKFKTAELYGKLLNLGDDIGNGYIDDNSTFKKLVTGEAVTVERKGADSFDFENYSKFIFAANDIPRINDTSSGLKRRLIIIPFDAKFDNVANKRVQSYKRNYFTTIHTRRS